MSKQTSVWASAMLAAGAALGSVPVIAHAAGDESMQWAITPYIWGANTKLDLTSSGDPIGSGNVSFSDLVDMLDSAFMVQVEGGKGHWSGFIDLTYLEISDKDRREFFTIDTGSTQTYLDAAMAYWPGGVGSSLSLYGGVRYTGLDDVFKVSLTSDGTQLGRLRSDKKYTDALLGVRYRWDISPRWSFMGQGDGSFGDSEGTWLLRGVFGYKVGQNQANRIMFGYQYKSAEFEDGDVGLDYTFDGPLAGFSFRF